MKIGTRIRGLREDNDMLQEVLAKILEVDRTTLSRIENNRQDIQINQLIKLCKYFSVDPNYVLSFKNNKDSENHDLGKDSAELKEKLERIINHTVEAHFKKYSK